MYFKILSTILFSHLENISEKNFPRPMAINPNAKDSPIESVDYYIFQLRGNELAISTVGPRPSIQTRLKVEGKNKSIDIAVNAGPLLAVLRAVGEQAISFDFDEERHSVIIQGPMGRYQLHGEDPGRF